MSFSELTNTHHSQYTQYNNVGLFDIKLFWLFFKNIWRLWF